MGKILSFIMYILWITTIISILATTFTDFQYEDLNLIAGVLFIFALINSFLILAMKKK